MAAWATGLWVTGEPFSYTNWAGGEPNNPGIEDWVGYTNGETPAWSWNNFEINNFGPGTCTGSSLSSIRRRSSQRLRR